MIKRKTTFKLISFTYIQLYMIFGLVTTVLSVGLTRVVSESAGAPWAAAPVLLAMASLTATLAPLIPFSSLPKYYAYNLYMYSFLVGVAVILKCWAVVAGWEALHQSMTLFRKELSSSLGEYHSSVRQRGYWDHIQTTWKCCGVDGPMDWGDGEGLPLSCCAQGYAQDCTLQYVHRDGCFETVQDLLIRALSTVVHLSIMFIFLEVPCCLIGYSLLTVKKNKNFFVV